MFCCFLFINNNHALLFAFIYKITIITVIENKCNTLATVWTMSLTFSSGVTSNHTILMVSHHGVR